MNEAPPWSISQFEVHIIAFHAKFTMQCKKFNPPESVVISSH